MIVCSLWGESGFLYRTNSCDWALLLGSRTNVQLVPLTHPCCLRRPSNANFKISAKISAKTPFKCDEPLQIVPPFKTRHSASTLNPLSLLQPPSHHLTSAPRSTLLVGYLYQKDERERPWKLHNSRYSATCPFRAVINVISFIHSHIFLFIVNLHILL
jgi:hypothetical protein